MQQNNKFKGYLCAVIAAVAYGTNPLGGLFLYREGLNPSSVIFYRYIFAILILLALLLLKRVPLRVNKYELKVMMSLGVLFAMSSLTLFTSFNYMDSGIASTILFSYPVMVAVIMGVIFKERITISTIFSIALSITGILLLYRGEGGVRLSTIGVILVIVSSLTYAIYIVIVNRSQIVMSSFKLTFYIMCFALITVILYSLTLPQYHIIMLPSFTALGWVIMLAIVPTVIAMVFLNMGIFYIGSTKTAILGALEPVTAVIISISVFGGLFTLRLTIGIAFILTAVVLIVANGKRQ